MAADEGKRRKAREEQCRALGPSSVSPYAAYEAHVDNIKSHFANQDSSRVDAMAALRMRVTGFSQGEIEMAIAARASEHRPEGDQRKHGQWEVYARKTAAYAFSPAGDIEASKWGHYTGHWLKIEGRGAMERKEQQQVYKHKIRQ